MMLNNTSKVRNIVSLTLAGFAAAACGSSGAAKTETLPTPPAPQATEQPGDQSQTSLRAALASYDAFNTKDFDAFKVLIAPTLVRKQIDSEHAAPDEGVAEYMQWFQTFTKVLPDGKLIPLVALANGENSAALYVTDTGRGPKFIFAEASVHDSEGRIVEIREHGDNLTVYHQLGVRPSEDAPGPEPAWEKTFAVAATGSAKEARNTEIVKAFFAADAAGDPDAAGKLVTENFFFRVVPLSFKTNTKARLVEELKTRHSFVDASYAYDSAWGAGDWVVVEYKGTLDFKKGPAEGKTLTSHAIVFTRLEGDKLAELYMVYNNAFTELKLGAISEDELKAAREKMMKMATEGADAPSAPASDTTK